MHPYVLAGDGVRYFEFCPQLINRSGQVTFSCTADAIADDDLKLIRHDDDWADSLLIPVEHYRGLRFGGCSPALATLLTRAQGRQV